MLGYNFDFTIWTFKIITFIKKLLQPSGSRKNRVDAQYLIPSVQHQLSQTDISTNALKVLSTLNKAGFEAYLVGGSVRDLLLRKAPKDFDIATDATPSEVRKHFRNARIIGRRFKLVHILFHREIIEVATFRAANTLDESHQVNEKGMIVRDNVFGNLEEDAWRRDFTINSLYYNLKNASIVDYTAGFDDIQNRQIRLIGDPRVRYQEDPVRMLRALRFSAKLQFDIAPETATPIKQLSALICHISSSRLFDEMAKFYQCGHSETAHRLLVEYGLFSKLFPLISNDIIKEYAFNPLLGIALENTDNRIKNNKPVTPAFLFAVLLWFPLQQRTQEIQNENVAPLPALEKAMSQIIAEQNRIISIPKRFSIAMREMWLMQYRLPKRFGSRPFTLLQHPRFRASYDFLAIRALAGDAPMELADWWTNFQEVDENEQQQMIRVLAQPASKKRRRPRKPKPS